MILRASEARSQPYLQIDQLHCSPKYRIFAAHLAVTPAMAQIRSDAASLLTKTAIFRGRGGAICVVPCLAPSCRQIWMRTARVSAELVNGWLGAVVMMKSNISVAREPWSGIVGLRAASYQNCRDGATRISSLRKSNAEQTAAVFAPSRKSPLHTPDVIMAEMVGRSSRSATSITS